MIALLPIAYSTGTSDTKVWFNRYWYQLKSMEKTQCLQQHNDAICLINICPQNSKARLFHFRTDIALIGPTMTFYYQEMLV